MATPCQALNVSDEQRCEKPATASSETFCLFHSKQCFGLYMGYKRRNAELDILAANPPAYLTNPSLDLKKADFADIESEEQLREVHTYLFKKHALLDRVIRARQLHHSRFFSITYDYGHEHYINLLATQRAVTLRALMKLENRTTDVLYKKRKWFQWVKECQEYEDRAQHEEKKRVEQQAKQFREQMKILRDKLSVAYRKEEQKRQNAAIEEAWQRRQEELALGSESEIDEQMWDPIEDTMDHEIEQYLDLLKFILWMESEQQEASILPEPESSMKIESQVQANELKPDSNEPQRLSKSQKKQAKRNGNPVPSAPTTNGAQSAQSTQSQVSKEDIETRDQMRRRLEEGITFDKAGRNTYSSGYNDKREAKPLDPVPPLPENEVRGILDDILQIKQLLFCRQLLSHANLIPIALKANSIVEFLQGLTATDLHDLCLKVAKPGLQQIRDACADFYRSDEADEEDDTISDDEAEDTQPKSKYHLGPKDNNTWLSSREQEMKEQCAAMTGQTSIQSHIDFGQVNDQMGHSKKMKITVCGRTIWNYRSESAMSRRGWLQFSIIAKDSSFQESVELCRNWDEFFDLTLLFQYRYFPNPHWLPWNMGTGWQELHRLGFMPFEVNTHAAEIGLVSTGSSIGHRRTHTVIENRNFVCAHMRRGDPITRRFLQYMALETAKALLCVRDAKTGRIITKPDESELWLMRTKSGIGRASRNSNWKVFKDVGPDFFQEVEDRRNWRLGFDDYYDVYIWDRSPNRNFLPLRNIIYHTLLRARRIRSIQELPAHLPPILKTISYDGTSERVTDIRPGDSRASIYEQFNSGIVKYYVGNPVQFSENEIIAQGKTEMPYGMLYSDVDEIEDALLFPDETSHVSNDGLASSANHKKALFKPVDPLAVGDSVGEMFDRFIDQDDEDDVLLPTSDGPEESRKPKKKKKRSKAKKNKDDNTSTVDNKENESIQNDGVDIDSCQIAEPEGVNLEDTKPAKKKKKKKKKKKSRSDTPDTDDGELSDGAFQAIMEKLKIAVTLPPDTAVVRNVLFRIDGKKAKYEGRMADEQASAISTKYIDAVKASPVFDIFKKWEPITLDEGRRFNGSDESIMREDFQFQVDKLRSKGTLSRSHHYVQIHQLCNHVVIQRLKCRKAKH
jgi:hypothetical protein